MQSSSSGQTKDTQGKIELSIDGLLLVLLLRRTDENGQVWHAVAIEASFRLLFVDGIIVTITFTYITYVILRILTEYTQPPKLPSRI